MSPCPLISLECPVISVNACDLSFLLTVILCASREAINTALTVLRVT